MNSRTTIILLPFVFITIGVMARLLPHAPNVAPITAMALFGGTYLARRFAFIFPLLALFLSDLIIGVYTPGVMASVYVCFGISGLVGIWISRRKTVGRIFLGTLFCSTLFFLVTNAAVWLFGLGIFYPATVSGLLASYTAALPFFRNTLLGDLFYVTAFYGLYELAVLILKCPRVTALASNE